MPRNGLEKSVKFKSEYVIPEFGKMFERYLEKNPATSSKIANRDFDGLAGIILKNPKITGTPLTISYELRAILKGNIIGAKGYLTPKSRHQIRDYVVKCFHIMHSLQIPRGSRMVQLLKEETGVNDVSYPPKEKFPYGP